jgi:magnesium transporter
VSSTTNGIQNGAIEAAKTVIRPSPETEWCLTRAFLEAHPGDAAVLLERLPAAEAAPVLASIEPADAAEVLRRMAAPNGAECLRRMTPQQASPLLGVLPFDRAAALLRRVEPELRESFLAAAPPDVRRPLARLLEYPEGTAGALMDPQVLCCPEDILVGEALARARHTPAHFFDYLYVVDRVQKLVGVLNVRELMLAAPKATLGAVMHTDVARLPARADRAAILAHPGWRAVHALPVVDDAGLFIGAIRYLTLRRLEEDTLEAGDAERGLATLLSLSELCWIGLSGVLTGLATSFGTGLGGSARSPAGSPARSPVPGAERNDSGTEDGDES